MSSLTISMIVCVDCQPCSSIVGLNTRSARGPGLALASEIPVRQRRAVQVRGLALGEVLRIDLPEVLLHEPLEQVLLLRRNLAPHKLQDLVKALHPAPLVVRHSWTP